MKRLRRWLFNIAAAVSLVLWLSTLIASQHSFHHRDSVWFSCRGRLYYATTDPMPTVSIIDHWRVEPLNWYSYSDTDSTGMPSSRPGIFVRMVGTPQVSYGWLYAISRPQSLVMFGSLKNPSTRRAGMMKPAVQLTINSWVPLLLASAIIPSAWVTLKLGQRLRRTLRERNNLCLICGYDLRATPARCPECGTIPAAAKGAAT